MRTITIYKFSELTGEAHDKVKAWYLAGLDVENFERNWKDFLEQRKFPRSHPAVIYKKRGGQDDEACLYGTFSRLDLIDLVKCNLAPDEEATLWELCNGHYTEWCMFNPHCACDKVDYAAGVIENLSSDDARRHGALLDKFNRLVQEAMGAICREILDEGRNYFYDASDDDIESWCDVCGYEFFADGSLYALKNDALWIADVPKR